MDFAGPRLAPWPGHNEEGTGMRSSRHKKVVGQALVEMALTFLILIFVIFGGISSIQILAVQYTVNQAVRTAVHEAALMGSTGGMLNGQVYVLAEAPGPVADSARNVLTGGIFTTDFSKATISAVCSTSPCRRYSAITVRVQYEDEVLAPIPMLTHLSADRSATRTSEKDQSS